MDSCEVRSRTSSEGTREKHDTARSDNRLPDRDLNPGLPKYEIGMPPIRHSPPFMQRDGTLPSSQEPASGSGPVPGESIPHRHHTSLLDFDFTLSPKPILGCRKECTLQSTCLFHHATYIAHLTSVTPRTI